MARRGEMRKLLFTLVILALLFTGCSKDKAEDNEGKKDEASPEAGSNAEQPFPFTGLTTDEAINQRPVAVMVNNHPKARPQSGLSQADIVFEILAEGSINRFLAIAQSEQPQVVVPVRSAREYVFEIADVYDGSCVCH